MSEPNAELETPTSTSLPMRVFTGLVVGVGFLVGHWAGACIRYLWPEPCAPFLVFGALWSVVFVGVEIARWRRPGRRLTPIYLIAFGLYFAGMFPLIDGLRDLLLGGAGKTSAEYFAVTMMSMTIIVGAACLLLRASFTREEERAVWTSFGRDVPGSARAASNGRGT
jgi:hypothetical protein